MNSPAEISRDEVFVVDVRQIAPLSAGPRVLWAAPGSLFVDEVDSAWARRCDMRDLADVSGPWAVAAWSPNTGLVLATDPMGVQPLFWTRTTDGSIAAASWLTQLVDRDDVDDTLDYEGILLDSQHFLWTDTNAHRTRFAAVQRVPWGRAAFFDRTSDARLRRYWNPADTCEPDAALPLADCAEILRERVDASIRRLLPADGAGVGAHVSGGLDCTSVACRAQEILREHGSVLRGAYTWSPDEREVPRFAGDERGLLDDAARLLGTPVIPVYADESGDWLSTLDPNRYPISTHFRERFVLPMARRDGVGVMLSGWGGDEFASFNGRSVFADLFRRHRWATAWGLTRDRIHLASGRVPRPARTARSIAGRWAQTTQLPVVAIRHPRNALVMRRYHATVDARLRSEFPRAADAFLERNALYDSANNHHDYQLALLMNGHLQHRTTGWHQTGRLFGVEYRYPLLDKDVVEAALRMPWHAFLHRGWDRIAFRLAVEPWVPQSIAWNVVKHEPAHLWPPQRNPIPRSTPAPTPWTSGDARYDDVIELGNILLPPIRQQVARSARVVSRPDLAVRPASRDQGDNAPMGVPPA